MAGQHQPVGYLAALLSKDAWAVLSAGEGRKGARRYEWAWLRLPDQAAETPLRGRWVLVRRSLADPSKYAYYRVAGPDQTTLEELVRVAGSRWRIEEGIEAAKGEVGLDHYEVRTWRAWYRYMTLALLAYAALVVLQGQAREAGKKVPPKGKGSL
jgi:SRSO17 transposase